MGLAEYRDATMRTEAELLGAIELPVLGQVPLVTTDEDRRRARRRRLLVTAAVALVLLATAALTWFLQLWKFVV